MTLSHSIKPAKCAPLPESRVDASGASVHRAGFIVLALFMVAAVGAGWRLNPLDAPLLTGLIILLLGVPHGAFDVALWKAESGDGSTRGLAVMLVKYVGLACCFFGLWLAAPTLALTAFIGISIYHFAGDWNRDLGQIARFIVAAAIITAPAALHGAEVVEIFSWLSPQHVAEMVRVVMAASAVPLLQAACIVVALLAVQRPWAAAEIAALLALAWVTPPLLFFLVYFCGLHSIRHMIETQQVLQARSVRSLLLAAFPYAPLAISGTLIGAFTLSTLPIGPALIGSIFMALGALTVPHIVIVDAISARE